MATKASRGRGNRLDREPAEWGSLRWAGLLAAGVLAGLLLGFGIGLAKPRART